MTRDLASDFDIAALYRALERERQAGGLTWASLAREISSRFAGVPAHPISPSTLSGMLRRRVLEADGVLQMLCWLNRTPESFMHGADGSEFDALLPDVRPNRILRFDTGAMYALLDQRRGERGMRWKDVASEIGGCTPAQLTQLSAGGRTSFPLVMRITRWLRRPAAEFTRASDW